MLIIEAGQICPHGNICPHSITADQGVCFGLRRDRKCSFSCSFIDNNGQIQESGVRNKLDQTGKMRIIME